jgi:bifunctional non-homologous end joining protein LigD
MFRSFDFCLPTRSTSVPDGPEWLHEVKYDGYRLRLERDGERVRLVTKAAPTGPAATLRSSRRP